MKQLPSPTSPAFLLIFRLAVAFVITLVLGSPAHAGGYMAVNREGLPYRWHGPITVHFDLGPLGRLSKAEADAFTQSAMDAWMSPAVPGSQVQFIRGSDLTEDHGDGQGTDPAFDLEPPYDGMTPIIYDQDGALLETLGSGASSSIVGLTALVLPDDLSSVPLTEALLLMNGKMISETGGFNMPMDQFRGAIIHEFGHKLGLGHSQAAMAFTDTGYDIGGIVGLGGLLDPQESRFPPDYRGMPTMFPAVLPGLDTLAIDDIYWMKSLYGDSVTGELGSISGTVSHTDGMPFNGANMVAYSVDDPTSMVTCVSGFTDAKPTSAPTGFYKIPGLPPGSRWIIDAEPIVEAFIGGSRVGPLDPPPALPGMPEFANEASLESTTDQPSLSTTFAIPVAGGDVKLTGANLQFNDLLETMDVIDEIDLGSDEHTGQLVPVTPGRMTVIEGEIDPAEPNPQIYGVPGIFEIGVFHDFYRVRGPAGLELNQVVIQTDGSVLDVQIYDLSDTADSEVVNGTASGFGYSSLSLYLDSSRIGADAANRGTFAFGVGFTGKDFFGFDPYVKSNYRLILLFSVSDRDAMAVAGTDSGEINPDAGVIRVKGRGFKNVGGAPIVLIDDPSIGVSNVTFIDENNLDVALTKLPGFTPGEANLQVINRAESGGYGGRIKQVTVGSPSVVAGWELY